MEGFSSTQLWWKITASKRHQTLTLIWSHNIQEPLNCDGCLRRATRCILTCFSVKKEDKEQYKLISWIFCCGFKSCLTGDRNWKSGATVCDRLCLLHFDSLINMSAWPICSTSGIISTFLHVHPFGASMEYICSYLQRLDTKVTGAHTHMYPRHSDIDKISLQGRHIGLLYARVLLCHFRLLARKQAWSAGKSHQLLYLYVSQQRLVNAHIHLKLHCFTLIYLYIPGVDVNKGGVLLVVQCGIKLHWCSTGVNFTSWPDFEAWRKQKLQIQTFLWHKQEQIVALCYTSDSYTVTPGVAWFNHIN